MSEEVFKTGVAEINGHDMCFHESCVSEVFVDGAGFESLS